MSSKASPPRSKRPERDLAIWIAVAAAWLTTCLERWWRSLAFHVRSMQWRRTLLAVVAVFAGIGLVWYGMHARLVRTMQRGASHNQASAVPPSSTPANGQDASSKKSSSSTSSTPADVQSSQASSNAACKLLTPTIARQVLGANAKLALADNTQGSTADVAVSTCTYDNDASSADRESISVVTHEPITPLGSSENGVVFGSARPTEASDAAGYGQAAYWNPETGELNILAHNKWYTLSREKGTPPIRSNLSEVEAVARLLTAKL